VRIPADSPQENSAVARTLHAGRRNAAEVTFFQRVKRIDSMSIFYILSKHSGNKRAENEAKTTK